MQEPPHSSKNVHYLECVSEIWTLARDRASDNIQKHANECLTFNKSHRIDHSSHMNTKFTDFLHFLYVFQFFSKTGFLGIFLNSHIINNKIIRKSVLTVLSELTRRINFYTIFGHILKIKKFD